MSQDRSHPNESVPAASRTTFPLTVHRCHDRATLGRRAGAQAAAVVVEALARSGTARVMLAAAPSQTATLQTLAASGLDFTRVQFFHMDDYLGLAPDAPQGFGNWLIAHFISQLDTATQFHRIDPELTATDSAARYAEAMGEAPFDLTLCGLGVNGHLAFNDPPADFTDPLAARPVVLDQVSRQQQLDEGHFASLAEVPTTAITVTIPRLLLADQVICSVPGAAKRQAVANTLGNPPDPHHPGTALKTHPRVDLYLDVESDPGSL